MTALAAAFTALTFAAIAHLVGRAIPRHQKAESRGSYGLDVTRSQFWLASVGAGTGAFVLFLAVTGLVVVSLVPALVVATLPRSFYARKNARRIADVLEAWPDGLRDLVSSVRAGGSLATSIESLGSYGSTPLRQAFGGFGVYSRSLGVVPALEMIRSDLGDPTSDRVIEVLILAHQRGGNVVPEILGDLAEATTRDVWAMEQVRSETLEQKINSRAVFVLPWLVLVAMTARSGAFRDFYSTSAGVFVVVLGGLMSLLGMFIAARLGRQPVEPRVFLGTRS